MWNSSRAFLYWPVVAAVFHESLKTSDAGVISHSFNWESGDDKVSNRNPKSLISYWQIGKPTFWNNTLKVFYYSMLVTGRQGI